MQGVFGRVLSDAEISVLSCAARGYSVPETAAVLYIGEETVKSRRNKIVLKLHARNIAHAIALGVEMGMVDSGGI